MLVIATLWCGVSAAQSVILAPVELTANAKGMRVDLSVTNVETRVVHDLDILIRLGRTALAEEHTALDDLYKDRDPLPPTVWTQIDLTNQTPDTKVRLTAIQQSPASGQTVLVQQVGDRLYVRYRFSESIAVGATQKASLSLPFGDKNKVNPLQASGSIMGYWTDTVEIGDFENRPKAGATGLAVLLRSIGLEGSDKHKAERIEALKNQVGFSAAVVGSIYKAIIPPPSVQPMDPANPLGVSARLLLAPAIDGPGFSQQVVTLINLSGAAQWGKTFDQVINDAKEHNKVLWAIAVRYLVPRENKSDALIRLLAMATHYLDGTHMATLHSKLGEISSDSLRLVYVQAAGASLLEGIAGWPLETAETALSNLGKWRVADAASDLVTESMWHSLVKRHGLKVVRSSIAAMLQERIPDDTLSALGSTNVKLRNFVYNVVVGGGTTALNAVNRRLTALKFAPKTPVTAQALAKNPKLLSQLAGQLQGILLAPLAEPQVAEAKALHQRDADCMTPMEQARKSIHPQLKLPEPLWSQCRALRAVLMMNDGKLKDAESLAVKAKTDQPKDAIVQARFVQVKLGRARELSETGNEAEAIKLIQQIDPKRQSAAARGLLADIKSSQGKAALEAGDKDKARMLFIEARRLDPSQPPAEAMISDNFEDLRRTLMMVMIMLLVVGAGTFLSRQWARKSAIRDFNMLSDETTLELEGPGGRKFIAADHALLVLRRDAFWMIPWVELREVFRVPNDVGQQGGILFWHRSGEAYFLPMDACDGFETLVESMVGWLDEAEVPFTATHSDEESAAAANFLIVKKLQVNDTRRTWLKRLAIAAGATAAAMLLTADAVGADAIGQLLFIALGIGVGVSLVVIAITYMLFPLTRA